MLSEHELVVAIRESIYPKIKELDKECLNLYNKKYPMGRGLTGVTGYDELDWSISLLNSCVSFLESFKKGEI